MFSYIHVCIIGWDPHIRDNMLFPPPQDWVTLICIIHSKYIHFSESFVISLSLGLNHILFYIFTRFSFSSHLLMDTSVVSVS